MDDQPADRRVPTNCARAAGLAAALAGLFVLLGWGLQIDALKSGLPGLVAMNPATAVAFAVSGLSLIASLTRPPRRRAAGWGRLGAAAVVLVALLRLGEYAYGWGAGVDQWLFRSDLAGNRMAPNTALCFLLVGSSLLAAGVRPSRVWLAQLPAVVVAVGALVGVVGYAFGAEPLYGVPSYIPMALNTAVLFHLLALGILAAQLGDELTRFLRGDGVGAVMVRRLFPLTVALPLLLGWLRLQGERAGLYGPEFGTALMVVLMIGSLCAAVVWTARQLNRSDQRRRQAEDELRRAGEELERRVWQQTRELAQANETLRAEIAERNRAAAAQRQSEEQFRLLVDGVRDYAILMLDADGRIASWNTGAERIYGYPDEQIVGRHFSCFYGAEDRQAGQPERDLQAAVRGGRFDDEGWRVRRDGSGFWANSVVTVLGDPEDAQNPDSRPRGFSLIMRDATEPKAAAERIRRLNADLERQVRQLAVANRELQQQNQENETFVYSVSHDLRSPLVNLQGFSKELELVCGDLRGIIADGELPDAVRRRGLALVDDEMGESIHFIQTAVMRLSHIIDALLRLSRVGRVEYRPQRLEMDRIVRCVVASLSGTIADRGAEVTVQELPPAWGDPTAVEQIFANLVNNALKYLDPQRPGIIEIGHRAPDAPDAPDKPDAPGQQVSTYYVRDNGLGIAPEYHAKVFQAFQRVHPEAAPGEGMGLAIVRRVVERHGGEVRVESGVGAGTTFFVTLPAPTGAAATGAGPSKKSDESEQSQQAGQSRERSDEHGQRTVDHPVGGGR